MCKLLCCKIAIRSFYFEKTKEKFKDFLETVNITDLKGGAPDELLLKAMKPLLEKMLNAKMDEHLGYKVAISRKYFLLDKDCQNLLNKKRALLKEIETLRSKLY